MQIYIRTKRRNCSICAAITHFLGPSATANPLRTSRFLRLASLPGMYDRTITIGSAGKAFSITGWHLGWAMAPAHLLEPLKRIHQNCIFTCATPLQEAVARAFERELALWDAGKVDESFLRTQMVADLMPKRDRLVECIQKAGFKPLLPDAGYFIMASIDGLGKYKAEGGNLAEFFQNFLWNFLIFSHDLRYFKRFSTNNMIF